MRRPLGLALASALIFGITSAIGTAATAHAAPAPVPEAQPRSAFQEQLDRYRTGSGSVGAMAVVRDGDQVTGYGSGSGTLVPTTELTADTRFRVGSQTKMFTAAVVLQLVDEGKVDLDATVEQYLPGAVRGGGLDPNAITIRHLLQHRSGIKDNLGFVNGDYVQTATLLLNPRWQITPPTPQQLVDEGTKHGKQFEPGSQGVYSNTNYTLLGMLVEKLTGSDLTTAFQQRIIDEVGMPATFYPRPGQKALPDPHARGYIALHGVPFTDVTGFEPAVWGAAAALVSTGRDMSKFVNALVAGEVVSRDRLADMQRTQPVVVAGEYGLGLVAFTTSCGTAWGHTGSVAGYSTLTIGDGTRAISVGFNNTAVIPKGGADEAVNHMIEHAMCS